MQEPDPMQEIHKIREKNYHETKDMSAKEYLRYIEKKATKVAKLRKKIQTPKDLETFFKELKNKRKAG